MTALCFSFCSHLLSSSYKSSIFKDKTVQHFKLFKDRPETPYKILKAIDPIFDASLEIGKSVNASQATMLSLSYGRSITCSLRSIFGITNLFFRVIPGLFVSVNILYHLAQDFSNDRPVLLYNSKEEHEVNYFDFAYTLEEKIYCSISVAAKLLSAMSAIFTSLVCDPILYLDRMHVSIGDSLRTIGRASIIVTTLKHASGFVGTIFDLTYQNAALKRAVKQDGDSQKIYSLYLKKKNYLFTGLIQKSLQLTYDFAKLLNAVHNPGLRLFLTFSIAMIGIYRIWLKTA